MVSRHSKEWQGERIDWNAFHKREDEKRKAREASPGYKPTPLPTTRPERKRLPMDINSKIDRAPATTLPCGCYWYRKYYHCHTHCPKIKSGEYPKNGTNCRGCD